MENEIQIFIATHKKAELPKNEIYTPIQVGAESKEDLGYLKDNTGDNISIKNPNYCELTALYWIWKNCKSDIVGLVHYRRYFFENQFCTNMEKVLSKEKIEKYLEKCDAIVPKKKYILKYDIYSDYEARHNIDDLEKCKNIIKDRYPEYMQAFDEFMNSHKMYHCNMIITKKEIFDKYCEWLFSILFELEKVTDISNYDDYNKRIYGFLSERLFNVFFIKNSNLNLKELPVNIIGGDNFKWQVKNDVKKVLIRG